MKCEGKTGVEMEAINGVQIALLTIYDMCKAIDKHMVISDVHLVEKTGERAEIFVLRRAYRGGMRNEASCDHYVQ